MKAYELPVILLPDETTWYCQLEVLAIIALPLVWKPRSGRLKYYNRGKNIMDYISKKQVSYGLY